MDIGNILNNLGGVLLTAAAIGMGIVVWQRGGKPANTNRRRRL